MANQTNQCMIEGCTRPPEVALELNGKPVYLCKSHFTQLVVKLSRAAEKRGTVSLKSLKVKAVGEFKVRVIARQPRRTRSSRD